MTWKCPNMYSTNMYLGLWSGDGGGGKGGGRGERGGKAFLDCGPIYVVGRFLCVCWLNHSQMHTCCTQPDTQTVLVVWNNILIIPAGYKIMKVQHGARWHTCTCMAWGERRSTVGGFLAQDFPFSSVYCAWSCFVGLFADLHIIACGGEGWLITYKFSL